MTVEEFKKLFEEWVSSLKEYKDGEIEWLVCNMVHSEFGIPGFMSVKIRERLLSKELMLVRSDLIFIEKGTDDPATPQGGLRRDAHPSASITSNSSFAFSFSRWSRNFSMSKRFFSSQSAVYWKLGCFVRSYLSDRNGLTPRSWRMHLPPSSTASSSTLASSWPVRW